MKKLQSKSIKAWAWIRGDKLTTFTNGGNLTIIYRNRKTAKRFFPEAQDIKIIPVTISYTIPNKKKK